MDILTGKEAAEILRISSRTFLRLVKSGKLPARKVGDQWRVERAELEQWFKNQPVNKPRLRARPQRMAG